MTLLTTSPSNAESADAQLALLDAKFKAVSKMAERKARYRNLIGKIAAAVKLTDDEASEFGEAAEKLGIGDSEQRAHVRALQERARNLRLARTRDEDFMALRQIDAQVEQEVRAIDEKIVALRIERERVQGKLVTARQKSSTSMNAETNAEMAIAPHAILQPPAAPHTLTGALAENVAYMAALVLGQNREGEQEYTAARFAAACFRVRMVMLKADGVEPAERYEILAREAESLASLRPPESLVDTFDDSNLNMGEAHLSRDEQRPEQAGLLARWRQSRANAQRNLEARVWLTEHGLWGIQAEN